MGMGMGMGTFLEPEHRRDWRMVAAAELARHAAALCPLRQPAAYQHVVDAPAHVLLAQVAPGSPPGEQPIVVRLELSRQVHETTRDDALELRLLRPGLADLGRLAQGRVHVARLA